MRLPSGAAHQQVELEVLRHDRVLLELRGFPDAELPARVLPPAVEILLGLDREDVFIAAAHGGDTAVDLDIEVADHCREDVLRKMRIVEFQEILLLFEFYLDLLRYDTVLALLVAAEDEELSGIRLASRMEHPH